MCIYWFLAQKPSFTATPKSTPLQVNCTMKLQKFQQTLKPTINIYKPLKTIPGKDILYWKLLLNPFPTKFNLGNDYYYLILYINKFWEISLFIDPFWGIIHRNWRVGNIFLFPRGTAPVSLGNKKLLPTLHKKWQPLNFWIQIWTITVFPALY